MNAQKGKGPNMANAKVHLQVGLFGKAACGKDHVDVTKAWTEVTCGACHGTAVFGALKAGTISVNDLHIEASRIGEATPTE